jgi:prepilin-type N-terminal cleavage/methylation domain-containing protein
VTKSSHSSEDGFTIVELLFAMTVFAVVLVAAAASLIQIGRMYYKGVISTRTQDTARVVIDELSRGIQLSGADFSQEPVAAMSSLTDVGAFCIGDARYTYAIDAQVVAGLTVAENLALGQRSPHVLWKDSNPSCGRALITSPLSGGVELLSENMRLSFFDITPLDGTGLADANTYRVRVGVVYGDDDLLERDGTRIYCKSTYGSQFCAVSELETTVFRRLNPSP